MKPSPLPPIGVTFTPTPCACHALLFAKARRSALVLSPPQSPLSEVTTISPTFLTPGRFTRNGWRYSGLASARWRASASMRPTYGREARIRSCAFFIFEAATISIALVILRVLCTLLILPRISFGLAIAAFLPGTVLLEVRDRSGECLLAFAVEVLRRLDLVDQRSVLALYRTRVMRSRTRAPFPPARRRSNPGLPRTASRA